MLIVAQVEERNVLFLLFFLHTEVDKNDKGQRSKAVHFAAAL